MDNSSKAALPFREGARARLIGEDCTNPRLHRRSLLSLLAALGMGVAGRDAYAAGRPAVALASTYRKGISLAGYAVSEKYDGVRGLWDGQRLWTRGGEAVAAPAWFTAGWPAHALDGELWAGRGRFAEAVSTARTQTPVEEAWRRMKFMVFDAPAQGGSFSERHAGVERTVAALAQPWLVSVHQSPATGHAQVQAFMERVVTQGGEGVVLRRLDAPWRAGRTPDLLKFKPDEDADALVLGHSPGQGKYAGMMGALLVETPEGLRFKIGTGFDDATRRTPPAVGSWISYRYRGETATGIPRFASYLRLRADLAPAT